MARTFPSAGLSPIDVYITQLRPGVYVEHEVTLSAAELHGMEIVGTPTMAIAADSYVGLNVAVTPAGTLGTWVSGIFAKVTQTVNSVDGYISAAEFEVNKSGSYTNRVYAILVLNNGNNIAGAQSSSAFIMCREYGSNVLNALIKFPDAASASLSSASVAVPFTISATKTHTHSIRIIVGTTPYWIMVTSTTPT